MTKTNSLPILPLSLGAAAVSVGSWVLASAHTLSTTTPLFGSLEQALAAGCAAVSIGVLSLLTIQSN